VYERKETESGYGNDYCLQESPVEVNKIKLVGCWAMVFPTRPGLFLGVMLLS